VDRKLRALLVVLGLSLTITRAAEVSDVRNNNAPLHTQGNSTTDVTAHRKVSNYDRLPIRFEPNVGQAPSRIDYLARGTGYSVALTQQGVILGLRQSSPQPLHPNPGVRASRPAALPVALMRLSLVHARAKPRFHPERQQESVSNYFIGSDRSEWHSHVPNYAAVRYEQVYPGIDWVVYGNPRQLEYDFVVAPQADPRRIDLEIDGAKTVSVDSNGDLLVNVHGIVLRQLKPVIYQTAQDGARQNIEGRYVLHRRRLGFEVGEYDPRRELIIDPILAYSTFLGGSDGGSRAAAIAVDTSGNTYIAGTTFATDFPTSSPVQTDHQVVEVSSAFVTKLNPSGTAVVYSTYLGGSGGVAGQVGGDVATALAVDASGAAYIAGSTYSADFPTLNAYQSINNAAAIGGSNAFVSKIDSAGTTLVYSTYLGGSGNAKNMLGNAGDGAMGIAVDGSGAAYVVGNAASIDFPTANAFQATPGTDTGGGGGPCCQEVTVFITKLNASGNALVYSTYLGPSGSNYASAIAVDGSGSAYVVGATGSYTFPVVAAFQPTNHSAGFVDGNAFVTKFNPAGNALAFSTYLGGGGVDGALAVAVDASGNVYVCGYTDSTDFPLVNALQASNNVKQGDTAFVTKFNPSGGGLVYSTYLGGSGGEEALGIAVDTVGHAYVTGYTYSMDFPTESAVQISNSAAAHNTSNAFISELAVDGSSLELSTYLGGSGSMPPAATDYLGDVASAIALDSAGNIYLAGSTHSTDFPTAAPFQGVNQTPASGSGFVTKIAVTSPEGTGGNTQPSIAGGSGGGGGGRIEWYLIGVLSLVIAARYLKRPAIPR
jgi:hypothetical protein